MAYIGGDFLQMTISHPTVGSMILEGISGADGTAKVGGAGIENEDNGAITGGRNLIISKRVVPDSIETEWANDMSATVPQYEFVRAVAAAPQEAKFTFSHISGEVYSGTGTIVGEITLDTKASKMSFKVISGRGFTRQ